MEKILSVRKSEATLGFSAKFFLKLLGFTFLFSIVPLIFVNLPLNMFLMNFGSLYIPLFFLTNFLAVLLSGTLAAKLIFAWGVNGYAFNITKEIVE
ncbi:hypothetical protein [Stutzerimonas nitrititolerans]|uniref:hypothetical protein n=1 Tax=Stutzerimonas nitrititolerans TaxID=2482751 RepID=UPI0028B1D640|nr:hypothetical protein [Stutzerimonas nitrititolerans]